MKKILKPRPFSESALVSKYRTLSFFVCVKSDSHAFYTTRSLIGRHEKGAGLMPFVAHTTRMRAWARVKGVRWMRERGKGREREREERERGRERMIFT